MSETRPPACRVIDAQHLEALVLHAVHQDLGQGRQNQFAGSFVPPRAAAMGPLFERTNGVIQPLHSGLREVRVMLFQIVPDVPQIGACGGRPADTHLRAQHPLDERIHFFFFDELAPVGLLNAYAHGGPKTSVVLKQTQSSILHELLGVGARRGGNLGKLRFLLTGEMYFHRFQNNLPTAV